MKTAILNVPDTGPLESIVTMLRAAGYHCHVPSPRLLDELRPLGGLSLSNGDLVKSMGYEPHFPIPEAGPGAVQFCDLFVDIKAHQTYANLVARWPRLEGRVLWYRINGGKPEHVVRRDDQGRVVEDCGDEVNPPCPVLTPNQWYGRGWVETTPITKTEGWVEKSPCPAYSCWPPFVRFDEYYNKLGRAWDERDYVPPVCFIHNVEGWGYRDLLDPVRKLGVRVFGRGSPDGLIKHDMVPAYLSEALAYVHLKSSDAPGYALYEALAAGCPVICTRRLIWRCRMQDLLAPGLTCLVFDRETHEGLTPQDVRECTEEVAEHLRMLSNPELNRRFGLAGRDRLREVMWREDRDLPGLKDWLAKNFPHS